MADVPEEDKQKIKALVKKVDELQKEASKLAGQSYSQSDPGAMMERRDNRRYLAKAERELDALVTKYGLRK